MLLRRYLSGDTDRITGADANPRAIVFSHNELPDFLPEKLFDDLQKFYSESYGEISEEKLDNHVRILVVFNMIIL